MMAVKKSNHDHRNGFKTIPTGTPVSWPYRGAIGHGTVEGVHKLGTTAANTEYSIREADHHVSATGSREKATVEHYGRVLTKTSAAAVTNAAKKSRAAKRKH